MIFCSKAAPGKIFWLVVILMLAQAPVAFSQSVGESGEPSAVVAELRQKAERVQHWAEDAEQRNNAVKFAQLNERSAELNGLMSILDQMIEAGPANLDPVTWESVLERFHQTFKESDMLAHMSEEDAVEFKNKNEERLLEKNFEEQSGVYAMDPLSSDEFLKEGDDRV